MNLFFRAITCAITLLLLGCGPSVMLTVQRPAEVNLAEYKTMAVGDFVGERGIRSVYSRNIEELLTDKLFETRAFEIVDRQNIDRLLAEQSLSLSGLVDETSTVEIGKLLSSAVLMFGRVSKNEYNEETSKSDEKEDSDGKKYHTHHRTGKYSLDVNIRLVDVSTGKILLTRTFKASKTANTSAKDKAAPEINVDKLFRDCVDDIAFQFTRMIAPYDERVKVSFEKDRGLPELDLAVTQIRLGDWDDAINTLRAATLKPALDDKTRAKAYYNYGLATMYNGRYNDAENAFRRAMQLRSGRNKYQDAIIRVRKEKEKAEELQRQLSVED